MNRRFNSCPTIPDLRSASSGRRPLPVHIEEEFVLSFGWRPFPHSPASRTRSIKPSRDRRSTPAHSISREAFEIVHRITISGHIFQRPPSDRGNAGVLIWPGLSGVLIDISIYPHVPVARGRGEGKPRSRHRALRHGYGHRPLRGRDRSPDLFRRFRSDACVTRTGRNRSQAYWSARRLLYQLR
jgi:hypothetical protein